MEVSYAITLSTQFTTCKFITQPENNDTCTFTINSLELNRNYVFRVKTQNAEGWSKPSDLYTPPLPLPAKPNPPTIKICSPTKVKLIAKAPEDTSSNNLPITEWRVRGYSESNKEIDQYYPHEVNCYDVEACSTLYVVNLNSNQ